MVSPASVSTSGQPTYFIVDSNRYYSQKDIFVSLDVHSLTHKHLTTDVSIVDSLFVLFTHNSAGTSWVVDVLSVISMYSTIICLELDVLFNESD